MLVSMTDSFKDAAEAKEVIKKLEKQFFNVPFNGNAMIYLRNMQTLQQEFARLEVDYRRRGLRTKYEETSKKLEESIDFFGQWLTFVTLLK